MHHAIDIHSIRDSLKRIMARKNIKPTTLSLQVGRSKTLVKDLMEKTEDVKFSTLTKLASALDVSVEDLLSSPRVQVVGSIGAGGSVIFEDTGLGDTVIRPPGLSGKVVALVVVGDSMLPKYRDGDIIYIQRNHDGVLGEYVGEDCAVRLKTGETFIKQLTLGVRKGSFTLVSLNASPMTDQDVEWATPILFIMPRRSRAIMG